MMKYQPIFHTWSVLFYRLPFILAACLAAGLGGQLLFKELAPAWGASPGAALAGDEGFVGVWFDFANDDTMSIAWGDYDNDGDLDLVAGTNNQFNKVYENVNGALVFDPANGVGWQSVDQDSTFSVAWGDYDNDGDLDLAAGNRGQVNKVYENVDGALLFNPDHNLGWQAAVAEQTYSVAWGDYDGDGDLDLAVGNNGQPNKVYENVAGSLQFDPDGGLGWQSTDSDNTSSVAWGDYDGDGDLDLAAGNSGQPTRVYENDGGKLYFNLLGGLGWRSDMLDTTNSVAWGDYDNDNDLDLAVGNMAAPNKVYENTAGTLQFDPDGGVGWQAADSSSTRSVAWGDYDNDGDLDLAVVNWGAPDRLYENTGGTLQFSLVSGFGWLFNNVTQTNSAAWGDYDGDGDLDLVMGNESQSNHLYENVNSLLLFNPGGNQGWQSDVYANTQSLAWGDYDGDGDLDLAVGNFNKFIMVYEYASGKLWCDPDHGLGWISSYVERTNSVAWGDYDGDGDLDLAVGNYNQSNRVYENDGGVLRFQAGNIWGWQSIEQYPTYSVAWGDYDGDGDLDLAVGNRGEPNMVYENVAGMLKYDHLNKLGWKSPDVGNATSVAWGDYDGDGDLDLAIGNSGLPNQIYENSGRWLQLNLDKGWGWLTTGSDDTLSIAWGDYDGDGDLDLAVGNYAQPNKVHENVGGALLFDPSNGMGWQSTDGDNTASVAWGDYDGDGDLDLAAGNQHSPSTIYENVRGALLFDLAQGLGWQSSQINKTASLAWGDYDGDGDLDLAVGNDGDFSLVYENAANLARTAAFIQPFSSPALTYNRLYATALAPADGYAISWVRDAATLPVSYTLYSPTSALQVVRASYSLDGGGAWHTAVPTNTQTTSLSSAPWPGGAEHVFTWDIFASGFFGQSDNVIFRLEALPDLRPVVNRAAGPYLWGAVTTATFPFRARGTQVRVMDAGGPVSGAQVYHLLAGEFSGAQPLSDQMGVPYETDAWGYLQGHGEVQQGDTLYALLPISTTQIYTLYATNFTPEVSGLEGHVVQHSGVQTITVSTDRPLMAFNLDITLEWDARNDGDFMPGLQEAVRKASTVLFDVSDGQAALGQVRLHLARQNWTASDVILYAQSGVRPRASMGGVTTELVDDQYWDGRIIEDAYGPGQIRIGPNWDPFGTSIQELTIDWQRALAHELAHYLLYLPDNYLGIDAGGSIISVDCPGSFMTNTYDDDYSEFLLASGWTGACLDTIAEKTTGRFDWETVHKFYEALLIPVAENPGPAVLPLAITQVEVVEPGFSAEALPPRFFDVRREVDGQLLPVRPAQVFIFQQNGTTSLTDDQLIPLGATLGDGDRVKVRGAIPGDRLCLFGAPDAAGSSYAGCIEDVTLLNTAIPVSAVGDWQPNIIVNAVTSVTLQVTVTLPVPVDKLHVQFFPAYGDALTTATYAPTTAMSVHNGGALHTATLNLDAPAFEGWVRVWIEGASPVHEALNQVFVSPPWGARRAGAQGDADYRAWGANSRQLGAPAASGDGQVTIFNTQDIFADTGVVSLQGLNSLPGLPSWLTPVGQGYRFIAKEAFPRSIVFEYLQREVPPGYEYTLTIYYSPDEGRHWQRLPTRLEEAYNRATAIMPDNAWEGQGIYALMATLEMPALAEGWNLFPYTIPEARPVNTALASIAGKYTSVYWYTGGLWKLFDATVVRDHIQFSGLVNDLLQFDPYRVYWLYATEPVTPYLGVPAQNSAALGATETAGLQLPPATYYGWVEAWSGFSPSYGMPVTAWVDGNLCGTSTVQYLLLKLAYKIQVAADTNSNGCGMEGRMVEFQVGGVSLPLNRTAWDTRQAWYLRLGPPNGLIFIPLTLH